MSTLYRLICTGSDFPCARSKEKIFTLTAYLVSQEGLPSNRKGRERKADSLGKNKAN